jgi:hypothetical protein
MKLDRQGPPIKDTDIVAVETRIKFKLPPEVRDFYVANNGGVPQPGTWPARDDFEPISVAKFLALSNQEGQSVETSYLNGVAKGYLPARLLPIAVDWGNNYICTDAVGHIYFYTTDSWHAGISVEENKVKNTRLLCASLKHFLDSLVLEDDAY